MDSSDIMNVEGALDEQITSNRVSKMRRSCELCRSHKAKCFPGENCLDRCLRCMRVGKQCIYLEAKPRPKRAKNSRARVVEMEEKLDGLLAILHSRGEGGKSIQPMKELRSRELSSFSPPEISVLPDMLSPLPSSQRHGIFNDGQQTPAFSFPINIPDSLQDVISKGIIDFGVAEDYVRFYRSKEINFPFVLVPPHMSLDTLRRDRPFLLLSVLSFSAQSNNKLQKTLELELRESLSRRVIVNGEKSMDVLQGVLVYLGWYHLYFHPERQQLYQLAQMVAAMASDLGLNKSTQKASNLNLSVLNTVLPPMPPQKLPVEDCEAMRALLGCYYLTSSVCQALRRPNSMKYNDYIGECCSMLAQTPRVESDFLLQFFIRFQQFAEEVNSAFDYDNFYNLPPLEPSRIELLVKAFNRQLVQFQESFPPEVWDNVQITMLYYSLRICVNEIGYHAKAPTALEIVANQSALRSWYYSASRSDCLLKCLQASKDYLDRYLSLPSEHLYSFSLPDLLRLVYAILVLTAFDKGCYSPDLDISQIRETTNIGYYLESLVNETEGLLKNAKNVNVPEYVNHLNHLFQASKVWHQQLQLGGPEEGTWCVLGSMEFILKDIMPTAIGRNVGYPVGVCQDNGVVDEQEQWADMLTNWSGDLDPVSSSMTGSL